jgi:hypothetical protein
MLKLNLSLNVPLKILAVEAFCECLNVDWPPEEICVNNSGCIKIKKDTGIL